MVSKLKILIAVKSCGPYRSRDFHIPIRKTWGQDAIDIGCDLKFFMGNGAFATEPDEIIVDAPDSYDSLTLKTIEITRWAKNSGYDFIYLCDTDTFIVPSRLIDSEFKTYDYSGFIKHFNRDGDLVPIGKQFWHRIVFKRGVFEDFPRCHPYASGGIGYFLSEKAMQVLLSTPKPTSPVTKYCEDLVIGQRMGEALLRNEITVGALENFNNVVAWHFRDKGLGEYSPEHFNWAYEMYETHRDSQK